MTDEYHIDLRDPKQALMAALAPDLLEALEGCIAVLTADTVGTINMDDPDWYRAVDTAVSKARAAIAKATGEGQ